MDGWFVPAKKALTLTPPDGETALANVHKLCVHQDVLTFHIFPKLDWESQLNVELTCKKWRIWCRLRHLGYYDQPYFGDQTELKRWIIYDIIFNNGVDLMAWLEKDMTFYFDGFKWLFKED